MEVAVVLHLGLVCKLGADAVHADRLGAGHLAHDIHIVDPAIDERRQRVHQIAVPGPGGTPALLVEIHAHDQRLSERACALDEFLPGGMHAQDVTDHEFLAGCPRLVHHGLGAVDGRGQRFFDEDVAAGVERLEAQFLMGVRIGVDGDRVGPGVRKRLVDVFVTRQRRELGGQIVAPANAPAAKPDDLKALDLVVCERVAEPHVADAHHEHPDRSVLHDRLPFFALLQARVLPWPYSAAAGRGDQTARRPLTARAALPPCPRSRSAFRDGRARSRRRACAAAGSPGRNGGPRSHSPHSALTCRSSRC